MEAVELRLTALDGRASSRGGSRSARAAAGTARAAAAAPGLAALERLPEPAALTTAREAIAKAMTILHTVSFSVYAGEMKSRRVTTTWRR